MKTLLQLLLTFTVCSGLPLTGRAADPTAAMKKAQEIRIPKLEFHDALLMDAISYLNKKSVECDPQQVGVNIAVAGKIDPDLKITMSSTDAELSDILTVVAGQAGMKIESTETILTLVPISK